MLNTILWLMEPGFIEISNYKLHAFLFILFLATASVCNVVLMRNNELSEGIEILLM